MIECYWCHQPLSTKEFKKFQKTAIHICEQCDEELSKIIKRHINGKT